MAFGSQLGLRALTSPREGVLQLTFESGEVLSLEPVGDRENPQALIVMERSTGQPEPAARSALVRSHVLHGDPYPIQVAIRQSREDWRLLAAVRIPRRQFTADRLAQTVELLHRWLDDALRPGGGHA